MVSAIDFAVRDVAGGSQRGTVAGEGQGNFIQVGSGDSVSLNLSRASVVGYEQQGGDLVVALSDGRKIVLSGYFDEAAGDVNHLYLSDNGTITEVIISETGDGMLFADYGPVQGWDKWSPLDDLRFAEADAVSGGVIAADEPAGMAALVPGLLGGAGGLGAAAAVVGGAAVIGGGGSGGTSGGGGDGNDTTGGGDGNDTTDGGGGDSDRAPPTVDAQDADPLTTNTTDPQIAVTGTGEPGDSVKVTVGGVVKTTTITEDGTWSVLYPTTGLPQDGTHTAHVVVTEPGGKTHTLTGPSFVIDMTPPDVETTSGTTQQGDVENLSEYADGVSLGGTGEAGAAISVVINGHTQQTTVGANGHWSVTFSQSQIPGGDYHTLPATITATDALGNVTTINRTIAIDTQTAVAVDNGQIGGDDRLTMSESSGFNLTGTAEAGASVAVTFEGQSVTVTANASGVWSAPFAFGSFGKMTRDGLVSVTATDAAGNTSTSSHTIHIDTEVQNFRLTAVDDLSSLAAGADAVNAAEALNGVKVSGTVEAGSTVTVSWGDLVLPASAVTIDANGNWTATIPASAVPVSLPVAPELVTIAVAAPPKATPLPPDEAALHFTWRQAMEVDAAPPDHTSPPAFTQPVPALPLPSQPVPFPPSPDSPQPPPLPVMGLASHLAPLRTEPTASGENMMPKDTASAPPPLVTARPFADRGAEGDQPLVLPKMVLAKPEETQTPPEMAFAVAQVEAPRHAPPIEIATSRHIPASPVHQVVETLAALPPDTPGRIELTLTPDNLGKLHFDMRPEAGGLSIVLSAERPDTLDLMRRHLPDLMAELKQAGVQTGSFSFSSWNGGQRPPPPLQDIDNGRLTAVSATALPPLARRAPPPSGTAGGLDLRF